ncbi:MAG: ATP-binding protein [Elainella sp.]
MSDEDLLTRISRAINPSEPIQPGDPAYVDCQAERGDANVIDDLGVEILRGEDRSCQLYSGHRGAGKSTELLRLKQHLEQNGCLVVYFAAVGENEDVDPEDAEYTDILIACTRHLLEGVKNADPAPVLSWFGNRLSALRELGMTEITADQLNAEVGIKELAKISTTIRAIPTERQKIRNLINPHTVSLLQALNEFIEDGKRKLPPGNKLVVIADNLDRIAPVYDENGRSNHDAIFLERSGQLRGLKCHLIYTIPISMAHSNRASDLQAAYGCNLVQLPMIRIRSTDGGVDLQGLAKVKPLVAQRVQPFMPQAKLEGEVFESPEALERLCLMSGGYMRELFIILKVTLNRTKSLPVPVKSVQRGITETRDTYRRTPQSAEWSILAKVAATHRIENDQPYRDLMFRRCILEYRYFDSDGEMQPWYDVHPLIRGIQEFKEAFKPYEPSP